MFHTNELWFSSFQDCLSKSDDEVTLDIAAIHSFYRMFDMFVVIEH